MRGASQPVHTEIEKNAQRRAPESGHLPPHVTPRDIPDIFFLPAAARQRRGCLTGVETG